MDRNYISLDVLKYLDRGFFYRSFQPLVARKKSVVEMDSIENRIFVQIFDNISFVNANGVEQRSNAFDYLDITDLNFIFSVSKEEFEQNYDIIRKDEDLWCKIYVKSKQNY